MEDNEVTPAPLETRIEEIDFATEHWVSKAMSTQLRNGLQRAGIHTLEELIKFTPQDLRDQVPACGIVGSVIIERTVLSLGHKLSRPKHRDR